MKAIVCTKYGSPETLKFEEVQKPTPGDNEILIEVYATCVNYNILALMSGKPFLVRFMGGGLMKPKIRIPGSDIAGRVEAVGKNIKQFRPGDEIFGNLDKCGYGAFAEYVCVPENEIALKPTTCSFEEAASVPQAAFVALQGLRDMGQIKAGQKVLIYGASGGIGTYAVQFAKYFGAEVTGVCGTGNMEMVRSLGANHVIDYTREDFTKNGLHYDLIFATAGYRSIFDFKRALSPAGIYVASGGSMSGPHAMSQIYQALLLGSLISIMGSKKLGALTLKLKPKDLNLIKDLLESGIVKPVIDRCYPFGETIEALKYYEKGHARGKVVIAIKPNQGNKI